MDEEMKFILRCTHLLKKLYVLSDEETNGAVWVSVSLKILKRLIEASSNKDKALKQALEYLQE